MILLVVLASKDTCRYNVAGLHVRLSNVLKVLCVRGAKDFFVVVTGASFPVTLNISFC